MTISIAGLASGLDINGMIEQLRDIQEQPIVNLQAEEADYQVKLTAYGSMKSALDNLKSAMENLDSQADLNSFTATSGDKDLFTVSADDTAVAGSYDLTVQQMAKVHKLSSSAAGSFSEGEFVGEGTLQLSVGGSIATNISVSSTDTISDVAQSINDADAGVQAAVVFDGTDYFLTLSTENTGAANEISLTATDTGDDNDIDMNGLSRLVYEQGVTENLISTQEPADAIFTLDGISDIHRDSNVLDDVIEGLTITLLSAPGAPDNTANLSIAQDIMPFMTEINTFVDAYNEVLDFFESNQSYDESSQTSGILQGDSTTNLFRRQLNSMVLSSLAGNGTVNNLLDLGISMDDDGRLEIDGDTLEDVLTNDFDSALNFFTLDDDDSQGFAVGIASALNTILDDSDGLLAVKMDGIQDSIDDIATQVEKKEISVSAWEVRTRAQFNAMELLLAEFQSTGDFLTQQIVGLQNFNSYVSNN